MNPNLNQLARGKKYFKEQNYGMAFAQLLPLAKRGNADAEYAVGYMYYYGYGIKVDKQAALTWMRKAGAQNNVAAKQALAMIDTPMWNSKPGRSIH